MFFIISKLFKVSITLVILFVLVFKLLTFGCTYVWIVLISQRPLTKDIIRQCKKDNEVVVQWVTGSLVLIM